MGCAIVLHNVAQRYVWSEEDPEIVEALILQGVIQVIELYYDAMYRFIQLCDVLCNIYIYMIFITVFS